MKKILKITLGLMALIALSILFVPKTAEAGFRVHYKIVNTKQNTWYTAKTEYTKGSKFYKYAYKVTVPKNSYLKIQTNGSVGFHIYDAETVAKGKEDYIDSFISRSHYTVLNKGTYYICNTSEYRRGKFRYSIVKTKETTNYCASQAITVLSNKVQNIVVHEGEEFSRWYKIKVPFRMKVTISMEALDDGRAASINFLKPEETNYSGVTYMREDNSTVTDHGSTYTFNTVEQGTYYIRVIMHGPDPTSRFIQLKWK